MTETKLPECFGAFLSLSDDCFGCPFADECKEETEAIEHDIDEIDEEIIEEEGEAKP
jgi:hypothetical protein